MGNKTKSIRVYMRLLRFLFTGMMKRASQKFTTQKRFWKPFLILFVLAANFQNCAPVDFTSQTDSPSEIKLGDPTDPTPTTTTTTTTLPGGTTTTTTTTTTSSTTTTTIPARSDINVTIVPSDLLDFGNVLLNTTSAAKTITITNNTPDDDVVIETTTAGSIQYFTIDKTSCTANLAPTKSCQIHVKFTASNLVAQEAMLSVKASKKTEPQKFTAKNIVLKGKGYNDLDVVIPTTPIDFGNVVINTTSEPKTITITNKTPSDSVSITVTQTNGTNFTIDSGSCATVAPNATCTIAFRFTPKDGDQETSKVTVTAGKKNDPGTPPIVKEITLTGKGVNDTAITVSPTAVDFGKVRLKTTATAAVQVKNNTPASAVNITASLVGTDFVIDSNSACLKQALASGATCDLTLTFTPTVTTLKNSTLTVNATKASDASLKTSGQVSVKGSGLILPPSSLDQLFLVGWYSRKETQKVQYYNRTADNVGCPAVQRPSDPAADVSDFQGQQVEFCYEPSGGHGLQLATSASDLEAAGKKLKDHILSSPNFSAVPTLDELFSKPTDHDSDNEALREALYYYSLGYLNIPAKQAADQNLDVQFNVHFVDDAIAMIINNRFAGYVGIMEVWGTRQVQDPVNNAYYYDYPDQNFPVSLRRGKDNTASKGKNNTLLTNPLKEGANTVMSIWLDDRANQRNIVGARLQYKSSETGGAYQNIPSYLPNVVQGYVYDSITGNPIANVTVQVKDKATGTVLKSVFTDAAGFYRVEGVTDGARDVVFSKTGYTAGTESRTLNHREANTAILDVSHGLEP